jgi:hypothetical protein
MQEEIRESQSILTTRKTFSSDSDNKAKMLESTEDILGNATSAVGILNDLLNYDKVEMGTLSLERSIVPIWDFIERTPWQNSSYRPRPRRSISSWTSAHWLR